jgi:ribosomal protein S18 acetylase RimI-like enzyme
MAIRACHHLSVVDIDRLEDRLYGHNCEATGHHDGLGLAFEALDEQGSQIGTIAGYTWAGMGEIRQLWVDKRHRGLGLGRKLIDAAVLEAEARGCRHIWVMTHSFQAPGLYEKCGFLRTAELADWPPGHSKIILRRGLRSPQHGE